MARYNSFQEYDDLKKIEPKLKKSIANQKNIEKGGKFYVVSNLRPKTTIFIRNGENVTERLENYVKKLTNQKGIYKTVS